MILRIDDVIAAGKMKEAGAPPKAPEKEEEEKTSESDQTTPTSKRVRQEENGEKSKPISGKS